MAGSPTRLGRSRPPVCCQVSFDFGQTFQGPDTPVEQADANSRSLYRWRRLILGTAVSGTDGSNPPSSSAESAANFVFGREAWKGRGGDKGRSRRVSTSSGTDGSNDPASSSEALRRDRIPGQGRRRHGPWVWRTSSPLPCRRSVRDGLTDWLLCGGIVRLSHRLSPPNDSRAAPFRASTARMKAC